MKTNENLFHNNNQISQKKLSKQNQELINNVSASGYKQFHI